MAYPFLITFKPVDYFYFGSLTTFGEGFVADSMTMPTQQTVLGCLRRTILAKHGLLDENKQFPSKAPEDKEKYEKLTGTFNMKCLTPDKKEADDLGIIEKLSPVFIARKRKTDNCFFDFLLPVPADTFYVYDEKKNIKKLKVMAPNDKLENIVYNTNGRKFPYACKLEKTKEPSAGYLGGIDFWEAYEKNGIGSNEINQYSKGYRSDEIFVPRYQPGIARKERQTVDKAFYYKSHYKMADEFMFAAVVFLSEKDKLEDDYVFLGGERSCFKMELYELQECKNAGEIANKHGRVFSGHPVIRRFLLEDDFGDFYNGSITGNRDAKLVLISPMIALDAVTNINFALIDYCVYMKMMQYEGLKTDTYAMLPAGSVLYPDKSFKTETLYEIQKKIGYNFIINMNLEKKNG